MNEIEYDFIYKINWARQKLKELDQAVVNWFKDKNNYSYQLNANLEAPSTYSLSVSAKEIPIAPLSLVVGDIVQNIRASLDHAVYELGLKNGNSDFLNKSHRSQFPIIGNKNNSGKCVDGRESFKKHAIGDTIKYIGSEAQIFIESIQPFNMDDEYMNHPLWILNYLSNIDKHRVLHVGTAYAGSYTVEKCIVEGDFSNSPVLIGSGKTVIKLGSLKPINPKDKLESLISPNMTVSFKDGPAELKPIVPTLASILNFVMGEVLIPIQKLL